MATPRGPARRGRAAAPARPPGDEVDAPPVGRVPPAPAPEPVPRRAPTRTIVTGEDGRRGVFVSLEAADLATDLPAPELARMIEALQGELAKRDAEIAALRQQIGELLAPPQTPDDFSAALQSTVDELQTELSHLSNPLANFAVKEFRLDTRVGVRITPLGTVEYRFASPGERLSPDAQSALSVTLVPVEKPQRDREPDRALSPERRIGDLVELRTKLPRKDFSPAQYLRSNHVFTIGDLLRVGARANVRVRITAALQVDQDTIDRWLDLAELLLLKEVDWPLAHALYEVGIHGLAVLRDANAEALAAQLRELRLDPARIKAWQVSAERYLAARRR